MWRRTLTSLPALLLAGVIVLACSPPAGALSPATCPGTASFTCSTVPVPLDRAIASASTINLTVERKLAGGGSQSAVIGLAGGPGQAAIPLTEFMAKALAPALTTRDLVVFDQRGTGSSDPLSCAASSAAGSTATLFERCALELGPARGGFTTAESVADIEAIRQAFGYQKLVLYGTSYGTKVALEYAERYPQYVEALVLDSVVPPNGPEPFAIPTFEAIPSVLTELCSDGACDGITTHAVTDIAHLNAQLRKRVLSGSVYDGTGHRHAETLDESGLLEILEAGDLNPELRTLLPGAVQSALRHDPDPLLRLHLLSEGLIPNVPGSPTNPEAGGEDAEGVDETLFVATSCEELPFPWQRAASPQTKLAEALSFLHAQPPGDFYPFDAETALHSGLVEGCAAWPDASAAPAAEGPLPNVPTLILSGEQDLRTPTTDAKAVAALIPDAQLEVVPYTGHSVLGSDLSGCAGEAVSAFFAPAAVQPCHVSEDIFAPTPIAPARFAQVHAPRGLSGRPGKTLTAALDTIKDLQRQILGATLEADGELPSGSSFGGLRGGYARLTSSRAILRGLSFVSGVKITGSFPIKDAALQTATVRVSGTSAAAGTVTITPDGRVDGTLGGRHFNLSLAPIKLSRFSRSLSLRWRVDAKRTG
jgi:pimeloyl-ACP methyl ester carboxylesterase